MSESGSDPSLRRLRRDLASADVDGGIAAGFWRVVDFAWPVLLVAIVLGDGNEIGVRLAVDEYPLLAPTGQPWDLYANAPMSPGQWPIAAREPQVFRPDWSPSNGNAPYLPCDRIGLSTHPGWATQYPNRSWNPTRKISFYLAELHHELRAARLPSPGGVQ